MANQILRDRDAIYTKDGLIFRVMGYSHPPDAYLCDAEYASARVFKSNDPRAPRNRDNQLFYKFYNDEGLKLIFGEFPQYTIFHKMLQQKIIGVTEKDIAESRRPKEHFQFLIEKEPKDELVGATQRVVQIILQGSSLSSHSFGLFGSMLHDFHNPKFSDIDLTVYGKSENAQIREILETLYSDNADFKNEFETYEAMKGKQWRFKNYSAKEFIWHQKRKQIYGLYYDAKSRRHIKTEFEPVRAWSEIVSEYDPKVRVVQKGWVRIFARVTADADGPFIPSIYIIEPLEVLSGNQKAAEAVRVYSYMEEFRLQVKKDERVYIEGNLEEVVSPENSFYQVTLTYCPRYYEQSLKVAGLNQDSTI